jgi:hypothetical protein
MKLMLFIRACVPYGILELRRKLISSGEVREPREGRSPEGTALDPPPPNTMPEGLFSGYTLNGKIKVLYCFCDSRVLDGKPLHNSGKMYKRIFRQLKKGKFHYYGKEGQALLQALQQHPVKGKAGIIWGLAGCNCEAMAVWAGADKVYVVDYNKPICDNDKIEVMNHDEITKRGIKADFAISYSSFEHDGLGRYGDPLSVDGDLRAMQEAHKFLAKDGILFLGVPLGQDCIVWNSHRIYGKHRLPLLLKGWQLLDVFDVNHKDTAEYPFDLELGRYIQNVLVLKRIERNLSSNNANEDECLFYSCNSCNSMINFIIE